MKIESQYPSLSTMNSESNKQNKALEKIGAAIEAGMQDSASRSISTMLQNDISTFSQGLMNANDAIAMMQIADSALQSLGDQTQTLNDLSVRYNSASLSESQKEGLRAEFSRTLETMQQTIDTTTYNGKPLIGSNLTFSTGEGSITTSIPQLNSTGLNIESQDGIQAYRDSLNQAYSDVGAATNSFISTTNTILGQITATTAAKSQLSDTDVAKAVNDFQQSTQKLDMAQIARAHQNDVLQQSITRLLG